MATLSVFTFSDPEEAERALAALHAMEREHQLRLNDAATVSWPRSELAPRTRQSANLAALGALDGAFWGMLFGIIFAAPFLGAAAGAAVGALAGRFADFGIDDAVIADARDRIEPGTSALFVIAEDGAAADLMHVLAAAGLSPEVAQSAIPEHGRRELWRVFGR